MTLLPLIRAHMAPVIVGLSVAISACSRAPEPPQNPPELPPVSAEAPVSASAAASSVPDWTGKWTGPEGTWLEVKPLNGGFEVAIQNLDGVRTFPAAFQQGGLAFTRDGAEHIIRAGSGADTGMKWLADKTNCLIVMTGEGYCRG
ncbi:hypothetical protein [Asticcacaulis endophyticus]|uniref:Uncharacterized protein n=1 Tax=Asticcacaulis endophyticus TaxID=1395890 RepID=A0A918Q302_9CAUL|nr:hypothetical protein [Asticcacaulis endophyticus]GGZ30554.1 hypothetical protein GCM10011273_16140 [Asticcacaulis endophyticus]